MVGQTQTRAPASASRSSSCVVRVRRVDDRRVGPETARSGEQLDRADAVLGEAFLDLARLLVGVDVQREAFALRRSGPISSSQSARAGADGVGGKADGSPAPAQLLHLAEVLGGARLPEALEPAAGVRDVEQRDRDPGLAGGLDCRVRLVQPEVVELADGRVAGGAHLAVGLGVRRVHELGASAAPPRRASAPARPRSHRPRFDRGAHAGTHGCARSRTRGSPVAPPRRRTYHRGGHAPPPRCERNHEKRTHGDVGVPGS